MPTFKLFFTGDYLDETGAVKYGDIGFDALASSGYVEPGFLLDQKPEPGDSTYLDRLYSLQVTPEHVAQANGILIFRPWVKASAFAKGAEISALVAFRTCGSDLGTSRSNSLPDWNHTHDTLPFCVV